MERKLEYAESVVLAHLAACDWEWPCQRHSTRPDYELTNASRGIRHSVRVQGGKALVHVMVTAQHKLGASREEIVPDRAHEAAVPDGAEAGMVPEGQRARRGMGGKVGSEPLFLRGAGCTAVRGYAGGDRGAVRVEGYEVPP